MTCALPRAIYQSTIQHAPSHQAVLYLCLTNGRIRSKGPRISSCGEGWKSQDSISKSFCLCCTEMHTYKKKKRRKRKKKVFNNGQPKPVMNLLFSFWSLCMQWDLKLKLNALDQSPHSFISTKPGCHFQQEAFLVSFLYVYQPFPQH